LHKQALQCWFKLLLLKRKFGKLLDWLPLLDLFRNHKLEFVFNFTQLKQSFQVFNLPQIAKTSGIQV